MSLTDQQLLSLENVAHRCLELGGKSPHIIFPDCDLDAAAKNVLSGFASFMGQACMSGHALAVMGSTRQTFVCLYVRTLT